MNFQRQKRACLYLKVLVRLSSCIKSSIVMYAQSGIYNSNYEIGINPLSLSSDLNFKNIILSEKDKRLPNIENFKHMEKIKSA